MLIHFQVRERKSSVELTTKKAFCGNVCFECSHPCVYSIHAVDGVFVQKVQLRCYWHYVCFAAVTDYHK